MVDDIKTENGTPEAEEQHAAAEAQPEERAEQPAEVAAVETPAGEVSSEPAPPEPPKNPNMKWYIIHSYSGFERKVRSRWSRACRPSGWKRRSGAW